MESLTVLLRYAHHQRLSRFVKTLSISGETGPPSTTYAGIPASTVEDMLTEALRSFANLETIRIDTYSYLQTRYLSPESIGLRCGPERLDMTQCSGDFTVLGHVFLVVIESAKRAKLCDTIHLDLNLRFQNFPSLLQAPVPYELFDPSLPSWKDLLSSRVRKVILTTGSSGKWAHRIAASCSSLQELSLLPRRGEIRFDNAQGGLHVWPHLRSLTIINGTIRIKNAVLNDFFKAHQGNLVCVTLKHVFLGEGSWAEILQTIRNLPALQSICFTCLSQSIACPVLEPCCNGRPTLSLDGTACSNRADTLLALGALLPVHTIGLKPSADTNHHHIDFTLANGALEIAWSAALPSCSRWDVLGKFVDICNKTGWDYLDGSHE